MVHRNSKRYPEEFKKQIVDLYNAGTPVTKLASEYGLIDQTIYKWIKLYSPIAETDEGETVSMKEYKELQKKMAQLEMENEILKSYSHIRQKTLNEIVAFIIEYRHQYLIKIMCKVLGIRRSTYYEKSNWTPSQRESETQKLDAEIKTIYFDSMKRYGAPKIYNILLSDGRTLILKRVQRRMVVMGLRSIVIKKYRHYSDNTKIVEQQNILQQDFTASAINQKWCTDIGI